jgi:hypothetical protein
VKFNKASSTNLTAHAKKHKKMFNDFESNSGTKRGFIQKEIEAKKIPRYDAEKSHDYLVQWIINDSQAFRAGENPFFQQFLESLHFDYKALKKDAIIQRTMKAFDAVKLKISDSLAKHPQKVSLTLDIWTSPSQDPFLCVTLHLIDKDWVLKSQVIAFRYIPGKHTGAKIALVLEEILKDYQIEKRILTVTLDNASNNDTLVEELIRQGILVDAEHHIRCSSHIINLAAQDCIYEFNDKLKYLRELVTAIRYSPLKLEKLKGHCNSFSIPFHKPILDVKTRWNSSYDMITRALELKQPLSLLTDELSRENSDFISLDTSDWDIFRELSLLLRPFKQVTERISGQHYATFNTVLPLYNFLMDHCDENRTKYLNWSEGAARSPYRTIISTSDILKDLIQATKAASKKFDKYYNIQSDYAIAALVLDPRLNVSYYLDENNPASSEQVESAKAEVLHYFEKSYKPSSPESEENDATSYSFINSASQQVADIDCIYKKRKLTSLGGNCEVTSYCALSPIDSDTDILNWWKQNSKLFPNLSKMAQELLAIPGTAVPSERVNSEAREMLPYTRNRLGPKKIEATLVVKSYLREIGPGMRLSNDK